ncbi:unknown protein [Seminavis robusta]|uniref:Uncharacterized protein n=1 Tax=Seminavis robusta TaxID=568900 RepID=A0A9N8F2R5_9STRA|nr:unknown protein [Seminavis robusta]|eukprot:Sro2476_g328781.1  (109) ;mRNA; f:9107-9433
MQFCRQRLVLYPACFARSSPCLPVEASEDAVRPRCDASLKVERNYQRQIHAPPRTVNHLTTSLPQQLPQPKSKVTDAKNRKQNSNLGLALGSSSGNKEVHPRVENFEK